MSVAALIAVSCAGHVDLGSSPLTAAPDPVTNERELAAQTTNLLKIDTSAISSLAIDAEFLYFSSVRAGESESKLWRCQKSNCLPTLTVIATAHGPTNVQLNANRLGWSYLADESALCDAPDCKNWQSVPGVEFVIWDEIFGYWVNFNDSSIYRCQLSDCSAGKSLLASSLSRQATPQNFALDGDRLYWTAEREGIMRAPVDGATSTERLTLGSVTEWTTARLVQGLSADVAILDMALDGPYIYAALRVGNQNANQTLDCDSCKPGNSVARWPLGAAGQAREWVLSNDGALTDLVHMRVFDGEMVWGTALGELWSCVADRCAASKRQLGIEDASSAFPPPWDFDSVAIDEQSIFWLSVPCQPQSFDCSPSGSRDWTLKRTPRIPR